VGGNGNWVRGSILEYLGAWEVSGNSIQFSLLGGILEAVEKDLKRGESIGL